MSYEKMCEYIYIFQEVCGALSLLHSLSLVHNRLRPNCILVGEKGENEKEREKDVEGKWEGESVFLYDFSGVDKEGETVSQDFLVSFSAPEVLKTQKSLFASDVYSAAKCLLFCIRSADPRFHLYDDR